MNLHLRASLALVALLVACSSPVTSELGTSTDGVTAADGNQPATAESPNDTTAAAANSNVAPVANGNASPSTTEAPSGKLAVTGTAPATATGKMVTAVVLDGNKKASPVATAAVKNGAFALELASSGGVSAQGKVVAYVDLNGDGVCNIAPTDLGGSAAIEAGGNVTLTIAAAGSADCGAFGDYTLTINGTDFTPHNNMTLYAALEDTKSNAFVTEPIGVKVANNVWTIAMPTVLVKGRAYAVRYFVDLLASGKCQDHSWIAPVAAATKDTTLAVTHDMPQTPICTNFPPIVPIAP